MWRAFTARRIAAAAAYGGGGITALGGITFGLVVAEARLARRLITATPGGDPPVADGLYGAAHGGVPLSLVMIGDSTAAGPGVPRPDEPPAAMLAAGLSAIADRPVRLTNVARSGARSHALSGQVDRALRSPGAGGRGPDLAVIMIGGNAVTGRVPPAESVRHLGRAVERLRAAGSQVVVGTCPDLGTVKPLMQPLRYIARGRAGAAAGRGGRRVAVGDLAGREFSADPHSLFSADRYRPSAGGYAAACAAGLPAMAAALGLEPDVDDRLLGDGVLPVYLAAAEAAEAPGTEVHGTAFEGSERGPRGRWAALLRRRAMPSREAEAAPDPAH